MCVRTSACGTTFGNLECITHQDEEGQQQRCQLSGAQRMPQESQKILAGVYTTESHDWQRSLAGGPNLSYE